MKPKLLASLALACACATSAFAETYSLIGDRYLRRYTADSATPVYNASVDAALIAEDLCKVPWVHSDVTQAVYTTHTDAYLDSNIANRESFDAASFCARHTNSTHWAYANAAVYRYELPDGTLPHLTNLAVRVFSDPYQRYGARIVLLTNSTGEIPTDCATVRGNVAGSIVATNVAKRLAYSIDGEIKWYPAYSNLVFNAAQLGASGLQLQKYLFVFVLKENYAYVNGNWIEGSSYIQNKIEIMTDAAIPTWTDGATVNLSVVDAASRRVTEDESASTLDEERDENDVTEATQSPWYGKMACYEKDMTVVKCVAGTVTNYFAAPAVAYRRLHRGETDLSSVTHAAFKYGTAWALGPATNLSASSGLTIRSVYPHQDVKLIHRAARDSSGYEYLPTLVDMTNSDVRLVADYATAFGLGSAYFATVTNLAASTRIPLGWILYTGATSTSDTDGDTLDLVHEWDNGIYPTNPDAIDTDNDTIRDDYELAYLLKGSDPAEDFDGDGLSNYSEYLISNVFRFASCDPAKYATDGATCDYFKKAGDLYLGEIFQDHDQVDDEWERTHLTAAADSVYDPDRDDDGDGWSNDAEAKAGTNPGLTYSQSVDAQLAEFPVPVIQANVRYAGTIIGQMNFRAWSEKTDPEMIKTPNAAWTSETVATNTLKYIGRNPGDVASYHLGTGVIKPGTFQVYFRDVNCQKVYLYEGEEKSSVVATDVSKWFYFVEDHSDGILWTVGSTNSASANLTDPIAVGTIDYDNGFVTVDYSKLPEVYYDRWDNGEGGSSGKSQGVAYNAIKVNLADSYVRLAWTPSAAAAATGNETYYLSDSIGASTTCSGHIREGLNSFFVWCDTKEDGTAGVYDPGEPFGFAQHVDVGWQGASFDVNLSEMNAITPRFNIWNASVNDRNSTVSESTDNWLYDPIRKYYWPKMTNYVDFVSDPGNDSVHVRFVRFGINHIYAYAIGVGFGDPSTGSPDPIVGERTYDRNGRDFINEGDFLQDGELDLDWSRLEDEVLWREDVRDGIGYYYEDKARTIEISGVTNITYLAVLDGGKGNEYWIGGYNDTGTVIRALSTTIERRFELVKHAPVASNVTAITYAARPTFRWTLPNEEPGAKKYGTTYTAFSLQIVDETGNKLVWDSGIRRAPAQQADGSFEWTADISAGDMTALGEEYAKTGNYKWRVAMFNAKFKRHGENEEEDKWSDCSPFAVLVNAQQPMNDHGYSSIDAAVKYFGPSAVIASSFSSGTNGKIRVQAFATGDFSGYPVSESCVTGGVDTVDATSSSRSSTANVRLVGIPAVGTYYLRAYIDSNGNHALDPWESYGVAPNPVVISRTTRTPPLVGVWIEDCDTDGDWLPDAYEFVSAPSSLWTETNTVILGFVTNTYTVASTKFLAYRNPTVSSTVHVNQSLYGSVAASNLTAGVSSGAPGASLTAFQTPAATNVIFDASAPTLPSVEYIRDAVRWRLSQ